MTGMNLWRTLLVAAVAFLALASPASAHVKLVASTPEQGAALPAPPQSIRLTFDDALKSAPVITVTDPNGTEWAMGRPTMDNKVVTVPCDPQQGPAGVYTVSYRVTGSDNHLIVGDISFTLTASFGQNRPAQAVPVADRSTPDTSGGLPLWIWIAGGVVLAAAFFLIVMRRRGGKSA
jgi:copper resistance protein C